ncbi:MAG: formylglycine-generating enzyme family protein [Treponema sp.]|jgi:formylglycine-generating enzyme required for sulfatase activity|nr:formylglycine-generating enzyme family protein [Treponema sp.]
MKCNTIIKKAGFYFFLLIFARTAGGQEHFEGPKMISIRGGTFYMGSGEGAFAANEKIHEVTLTSFAISESEVTQELYESVMTSNPSRLKGANLPVENVSWLDAVRFCNLLSQKAGLGAAYTIEGNTVVWNHNEKGYRLPTEAEWEYAARGGLLNPGPLERSPYSGGFEPDEYCWHRSNSGGRIQPVKTKLPNQLGLYDMSGNVWEWCWDWHNEYPDGPVSDPDGGENGRTRIIRGGAVVVNRSLLRVTFRVSYAPAYKADSLGFRIVQDS